MSKDLLVKDLMICFLSCNNCSAEDLQIKIQNVLSSYSVSKMKTTLPSTGDGSTTKYLFELFMKDKMAIGRSEGSLKQYFLSVQKLYAYLKKEVTLVTKEDIVNYLNYYKFSNPSGEQKPNTVRNRYMQLSSFFGWLHDNKYIADNPFAGIPTPKGNIPSKQVITNGELEKITVSCEDTKKGIKLARDLAMISFMYDSGVRAGELSNIKIKDINWDKNQAIVRHGKGDKSRIVPFGEKTKVRLEKYLSTRNYTPDDYLFVHYFRNHKLGVGGIERNIKQIGESSKITRLHPHLFRASFATKMIQKGVSPSIVKTVLGHSSLTTLESYVQITETDINQILTCY